MKHKSGSFRAPKSMKRFGKFIEDMMAERRRFVSADDVLGELLKRARY